jgi:molecular chaperone GrpE
VEQERTPDLTQPEGKPTEGTSQEAQAEPAAPPGNGQASAAGVEAPPAGAEAALQPPPAPDPLAEARKALADSQDKHLRLQAEFDNYKKRIHKEQQEAQRYVHLPLLRDLTGVMDNLERAIEHARNSSQGDVKALTQGLDMVVKQLGGVFDRFGLTRIAAKGQPFDPRRHEAMKVVEADGVPEGTVTEELQAGYALHERIVRPAMVAVSRKPQAPPGEAAAGPYTAEKSPERD